MERITLEIDGLRRQYLLHTPPAPGAPLVVFLHGAGATAEWADDETGWSNFAQQEGFALALPQGLCPDPNSPPKFLTNPARWNDHSPSAREANLTADDVGFLVAVMDDAQARAGIDSRRVFVSGFSNGAGMAFRLAAERADRLAAVAPVAGHCWVDPKPGRPVPTLYLIGSIDPLIPLRGGEVRSPWQHRYVRRPPVSDTLDQWARAIGCDPITRLESDTHGLRVETYPGPVAFQTVTIDGLGHHWPGGKGRLNQRIAGPPSDRVNGTELVWAFFKSQSM